MKNRKSARLRLEALEPRMLLSATLLGPLADTVADMNGPDTVLDLSASFDDPARAGTIVQFDTVLGSFEAELFEAQTPATVANFLNYVYDGDYTSSLIHRSVEDFVVQGGGFTYPGWYDVPADAPVVNEPGISNVRGTIAMAKLDGDPNSATSQIFVNLADNSDPLDTDNGGFTVFGQVLGNGMDVVDAIAAVPTYDFGSPWEALPLMDYDDVEITDDNVVLVNAITPELTYTIVNDNPTLVTPVVWGNTLTLEYAADQTGTASITVTAQDLDGGTVEDTFVVTVEVRPEATDDQATALQNQAVVIDVLANDVDGQSPIDPTTVTVADAPAHGATSVNATTGAITYTPAPGYAGADTFTYTVADDEGRVSDPATVSVEVSQAPVVVAPIADVAIDVYDPAAVIDLSGNFDDPDFAGTIVRFDTVLGTFDVELLPNDAPATVANFLNYVYDGDYTDSLIHHSEPGTLVQGGGYTYPGWWDILTDDPVANEPGISNTRGTLAMDKLDGDPDSATSQWFVNLADNSDPFDTDNGGNTVFGQVLGDGMDVVDAIAAVPTYDFGEPWDALPLMDYDEIEILDENVVLVNAITPELTYTVTVDNPDMLTATVWGDTLTLTGTAGQWGTANVTVRATDVTGHYVEDTFAVAVQGRPDAVDDRWVTHQDQAAVIDVVANDEGGDRPLDPTTVTVVNAPANGTTSVNGTTGAITYTPAAGSAGADTFTYTVADDEGKVSDPATVYVDVSQDPTLLAPLADLVVDPDAPDTLLDLSAHFDDLDVAGTVVRFDTVLGYFDVELFGDDTPATVANFLNYVYDGDYTDSVIHRSVPDFVVQGGGFSYPTWGEVPTDDPVVNEPGISNTYGTLTMAKVEGDPDSATSGWFVNIADNSENLDSQNGGFTVFGQVLYNGMDVVEAIAAVPTYDFGEPWDTLPLMDYDGVNILEENVVLVNSISAELTYTVTNSNPGLITATVWGDTLTLAKTADQSGTATITVRATDLAGDYVEDTFTITVLNPPDATDDRASTHPNEAIVIDVLANDEEGEHPIDAATVTVVGAPANGTTSVDAGTGAITYTPNAGAAGPDTFTYTVADTEGYVSNAATVYVDVNQDPVVLAPLADLEIDPDAPDTVLDLSINFDDLDFAGTLVRFDTVLGTFDVELFPDDAPATVDNFLAYAYNGDYAGSLIHHSEPDTLIQGGGYWYPGWYDIPTNDPVVNEPGLSNTYGTLAMDKLDGDPDSATSQWFVNLADNSDPFDTDNGGYTVFGQVLYNGMDVVEAIAAVPTYDFGFEPWDALPLMDYDEVTILEENVVLINSITPELTYTVTSSDPDLVTATVWGDTLTVVCMPGQSGTADLTVRATDLEGDYVEDTFAVTIKGAPLPTDDVAYTNQDNAVVIDVLANDLARGIAIDPTTVVVTSGPSNGYVVVSDTTGAITYTPAPAFYGADALTYTVADVEGGVSLEGAVTVEINATPVVANPIADLVLGIDPDAIVLDLTGTFTDPDIQGTVVEFDSVLGQFYVALYDIDTPATVANFLTYVNDGDYTDSIFHRSVADFIIQGGGFTYPTWAEIPTDDPVVNEPGISNTRGTIAMAKVDGDPNSATSGWFVNLADNSGNLDDQNGGFTVFGYVLGDGMDVVDAIAALPTYDFGSPYDSLPLIDYDGVNVYEENVAIVRTIEVVDEVAYSATSDNPALVTPTVADDGTLTLDVTPGAWGTATITVRADDREGGFIDDTFTIAVQGEPLANNDADDTNQGTPVVVNVVANDTARGIAIDPATVVVTAAPANGAVAVNPTTGAITYTPNAGFMGRDSFAYAVSNTNGQASDPATVDIEVLGDAVIIGDGFATSLKYTDADGTLVTVTMRGGTADVFFTGYLDPVDAGARTIVVTGVDVTINRIELVGTTTRSSLSFTTSRGTVAGATVGTIMGDDPVGRLSARTIDLDYRGIVMAGDGYIADVQLHDITDGADILMLGDGATRGVRITLANVADPGTDITLGSYLNSLTATRWVGSTLTTPWVSRITIRGDRRRDIDGDFGVDMTLSGIGATRDTLGNVSVAGQITGGTWDVDGDVGMVRAASTAAAWQLDAEGYVKMLTLNGDLAGTLTAEWFNSIRARGNLSATITATGTDTRGTSISTLQAASVPAATIVAPGGIRTIRTADWLDGSITAAWISSLTTSGDRRLEIDGHFLADITLSGLGNPRQTLSRASIAGDLANCTWDITGDVGTITADRADVANWNLAVHSDVRSISLGIVYDTNLDVDGAIGSLQAKYWSGGTILADSLGTLTISGDRRTQVPGHIIADVTLTGEGVAANRPTLGTVRVTNGIALSEWDITGDVGSITAGFVEDWTLDVHSSVKSLKLGTVTDGTVIVDGDISTIDVISWDGGAITADFIKTLTTKGDTRNGVWGHFAADLTLTGEGATRDTLGRVSIKGSLHDCTWDITGDVSTLATLAMETATIGIHSDIRTLDLGYVTDGTVVIDGSAATAKAIVWDGGALTADWITRLDIKGDFGADLTLTGEGATRDTLGTARIAGSLLDATWQITGNMSTLAVTGWMANSTLRIAGDTRSITLGAMDTSNIYAGVADGITGLPDPAADFAADYSIGSVSVKGFTGVAFTYINSNIAASALGTVSIRNVQPDNAGTAFGIAAQDIRSLTWRQDTASYRWPTPWPWIGFTQDFVVETL